jgi:pimeloyl-ACP methyl ester carboxylesterase
MAKDNMNKAVFDNFREKSINVGKIKVNIAEAGEGVPIIMIHGWTNDWRGLAPMGSYLIPNARVILVDLPGYGQSSRLKHYSLKTEAEAIDKLRKELGINKFYILGHSMGSFVAAKYYQNFGDNLLGLIMVGGVFRKKARKRLFAAGRRIYGFAEKHENAQKVLGFLIKRKAYAYTAAWLMNMYKFDHKLIDQFGLVSRKNIDSKAYVEIGDEVLNTDTEKLLGDNNVPVLFLYGKYDKICNATQAKVVVGTDKYQFVEIEEAGHVVTVEQPKKAAVAIWKFMKTAG